MYIKPLLKPKNIYNKMHFEIAYLAKNVKKLPYAKSGQKCYPFFGHLVFSTNHQSSPIVEKSPNLVSPILFLQVPKVTTVEMIHINYMFFLC
jgi:hypothetical protein